MKLHSLELTRFRSFIQPTTVPLEGDGLRLLAGENRAEPRLGGNGAGKSTIWDGVVFALYGTSVKGARAGDLVARGHTGTEVTLTLAVDGVTHTVRRTAPPNRLYLDGELVEQAAVDRLVGLTKPRFLHSVVFGQAAPLFLDLSVPERGEVLDGILHLEVWLKAAELATRKHRDKTTELTEIRRRIAHAEGVLQGLGDPARLAGQIAEWNREHDRRLEEVLTRYEATAIESEALQGAVLLEQPAVVFEREAREEYELARERHLKAQERLTRAEVERKQLYDTAQFLATHATCPTCTQPITREHVAAHTKRHQERLAAVTGQREIAALDLATLTDRMRAAEVTWRGAVTQNQRQLAENRAREERLAGFDRELARLEAEAEQIAGETNPYQGEYDRITRQKAELTGQLTGLWGEQGAVVETLAGLEFWRQGFRRCRLYCLEQVLAELTLETRNALLALGLVGWEVGFTTASETRSGTMRLGVQADLKSPGAAARFELCSGGEGQRARLAVSLGLARLIHRWAGVRVGFEVWDEPTAWLSDEGIADLLECLAARAETTGKAVWVCDHRALSHGTFRGGLTVIKEAGGSRLAGA